MARKKDLNNNIDVRQAILDASVRLFAEKGFDATGIEEIAQTAGITKSLIYYYFKGKDEILAELLNSLIQESSNLKRQVTEQIFESQQLSSDDLIRELKAKEWVIQLSFEYLAQRQDLVKILTMESMKEPFKNCMYEFMDGIFNTSLEICEMRGLKMKNLEDLRMMAFFVGVVPIFLFEVYYKNYAQYYGQDAEKMKERFSQLIYKVLVNMWPDFLG